ncbi:MAG: hypothetical protein AAFP28_11415 [Pseudomonadota bacterium]
MSDEVRPKGFRYLGATLLLVMAGAVVMTIGAAFDVVVYGPDRGSPEMSPWAMLIGCSGIVLFGWGIVRFIVQGNQAIRMFFRGRPD